MLLQTSLARQSFADNHNEFPSTFCGIPCLALEAPLRIMRGSSNAVLVRANDSALYVVKRREGGGSDRKLVNELITACIAHKIGLSTPEIAFLLTRSPGMASSNWHFGSRYYGHPQMGPIEWVEPRRWDQVERRMDLVGAVVLDVWLRNGDSRQVVYGTGSHPNWVRPLLIDHGECMGGTRWKLVEDLPLSSGPRTLPYPRSIGWSSIGGWISAILGLQSEFILGLAEVVPPEWKRGREEHALHALVRTIEEKRKDLAGDVLRAVSSRYCPFRIAKNAAWTAQRAAA